MSEDIKDKEGRVEDLLEVVSELPEILRKPVDRMTPDEMRSARESVMNNPHLLMLLKKRQLRKIHAAQRDPVSFFEYVMREETTRKPIAVAPHQKVIISFVMAHPFCVLMLPVGHAKTFTLTGLCLYFMGQDQTLRGAILSATQTQAMKPLGAVRDYIETSPELRTVFPHMKPSTRSQDKWTQDAITIDRPPTIRDPSLVAVGVGGALAGARLNFILIDDILNQENTSTPEQRTKVYEYVQSTVVTRLDPKGARLVVTNTAWHPDDLPHELEKLGRPTLRMSASGDITITGEVEPDWAVNDEIAKELRPKTDSPYELTCRLTANDPDPDNEKTLWPDRLDRVELTKIQKKMLPHRFKQAYEQECRDDGTARCKQEYIDACLETARRLGITKLALNWNGEGSQTAFTGIDLAVRQGEGSDDSAFFTFYVRPDGVRVILDIDFGQWSAPMIIERMFAKHRQYNSVLRVENNASQDYIRQMALQRDQSLPVDGFATGKAKADPVFGVESLFVELANGMWAIPNDRGRIDPRLQRFIKACLYYTPEKHTDDVLMAAYMAMTKARKFGVLSNPGEGPRGGGPVGLSIMSR